jgi:hypothetical protein
VYKKQTSSMLYYTVIFADRVIFACNLLLSYLL